MGKEIRPEDFKTRAEKVKAFDFPHSNEQQVIVQANEQGIGFRLKQYKARSLKDRVDQNTFEETVKKCNKICEDIWRRRKMEEEAEYSIYLKYILYVAILFSIISFILLIVLVYGDGQNDLLYASIALIVIASVLTLIVVVKSVLSEPNFIDLEATAMKELTEFLSDENKRFYNQQHLEWKVGEKFYYLELHILE